MRPCVIICNTREDAYTVKKELDLYATPNAHINKSHFQYPQKSGVLLGTWKNSIPVDVPVNFPHRVFVQNELAVKEFIQEIVTYYAPEKEQHRENFAKLKALFPDFVYEEHDRKLDFYARLKRKNYVAPVDLEDVEKGYEMLFLEWLDQKIAESYKKQYPFLYLYGYKNYWNNGENIIYVSTVHPNYPNNEGTSTGFHPTYPPSSVDAQELKRLNIQAQKYVEEKDNFFCSGCRQTLPREQYGAFLFHVVKCKDCATSQFIKAAKEETYN